MGKHLSELQEGFFIGLLKAGKSYRQIKEAFLSEFGKEKNTLGDSAIARIVNLTKDK